MRSTAAPPSIPCSSTEPPPPTSRQERVFDAEKLCCCSCTLSLIAPHRTHMNTRRCAGYSSWAASGGVMLRCSETAELTRRWHVFNYWAAAQNHSVQFFMFDSRCSSQTRGAALSYFEDDNWLVCVSFDPFIYLAEVEISPTAQPNEDLANRTSKKNLK